MCYKGLACGEYLRRNFAEAIAFSATTPLKLYSPKGESYFQMNPGRSFAIFEEWVWFFFIEETALQLCSLYSPITLFTISIGVYGQHSGSLPSHLVLAISFNCIFPSPVFFFFLILITILPSYGVYF